MLASPQANDDTSAGYAFAHQAAVPADIRYRLRRRRWRGRHTMGAGRRGSRATPHAAVDSAGEITAPRRAVWIVATAGGWRTDSANTIGPASSRLLLHEDWRQGLDVAWVRFRTPARWCEHRQLPGSNGDSTYQSGGVLARLLPYVTDLGVGMSHPCRSTATNGSSSAS
jgi:hypothetical protein